MEEFELVVGEEYKFENWASWKKVRLKEQKSKILPSKNLLQLICFRRRPWSKR